MCIVINPDEWLTEKERKRKAIADRFREYREALTEANLNVPDKRIFEKLSKEFSLSITHVRKVCIDLGAAEKREVKTKAAAV